MSDLDRLQDAFMKADARAQAGDPQAREDARAFAQEIRRLQSAAPASGDGFMGQVNAGIADSVGGLADFINPFSRDVWSQYGMQTGSASEGLRQGMGAIGADVADGNPTTLGGAVGRGMGQAAGAIIPITGAARGLQAVGGVTGAVAGQVAGSLATRGGFAAEVAAGGLSAGGEELAREAGAPEWVQGVAAVAAPMAIPAAGAALQGADRAASNLPVYGAVRGAVRSMLPMTEAGSAQVARERLQGLAGGPERAGQVGGAIRTDDPLGRTPAQQTGDPNLLGIERAAADESPVLRERLAERARQTGEAARADVAGPGGDVADAKAFLRQRTKEFKTDMQARVDRAIQMADESLDAVGPRRAETTNSERVVTAIKQELDAANATERELWRAVPMEVQIETRQTKGVIQSMIEGTPWAQRGDIPVDLRAVLDGTTPIGDTTTVFELHGLYSAMRQVSRTAMAGANKNENIARIANNVAEAILEDLGAKGGEGPAGIAINEARAFSRTLHETFDQGAVGRILRRTLDGDEAVASETALARTVGRGGAQSVADERSITKAAPRADEDIADYLRGRFIDATIAADGTFSPKQGAQWLRQNRELLGKYPKIEVEMRKAMTNRSSAEAMASRAAARMKLAEAQSPVARFTLGPDEKAVFSILGADQPAQAARSVMAAARKDPSGKAVAGVKAAFRQHLIGKAGTDEGLSGQRLDALLKDKPTLVAMRQVFDGGELARLQRVASDLAKAQAPAADVGSVVNAPSNAILSLVARVAAARAGGNVGAGGGMGGSLQTANIFVGRARAMLDRMTNAGARDLLMAAVEDPVLFKSLLMTPARLGTDKAAMSRIAPYLTGASAAQSD